MLYNFILFLLTDSQILRFRPKIYLTTLTHIIVAFPQVLNIFTLYLQASYLISLLSLAQDPLYSSLFNME